MKGFSSRPDWVGFFLLGFGVMTTASSVLFIKASSLTPAELSAARLFLAALVLVPFWLRERRAARGRGATRTTWQAAKPAILPGVFLGMHFISWNAGARGTLAGNATLLVNMVPLVMPLLAWVVLREKLTRRELAGTFVALAGVAVLGFSDYRFSPEHLAGDAICFGSMVLYSIYLVMGRQRAKPDELLSYLTPLYTTAGLVSLVWLLLFELPLKPLSPLDPWLIAGLAAGPTLIGHSIANWALTRFPAQTVSLVNINQFVFAGIMSFFLFREVPHVLFYVTAALVIAGAWIALARSVIKSSERSRS